MLAELVATFVVETFLRGLFAAAFLSMATTFSFGEVCVDLVDTGGLLIFLTTNASIVRVSVLSGRGIFVLVTDVCVCVCISRVDIIC